MAAINSTIQCILDCDAGTFSFSVDGGAAVVAFDRLPVGNVLYPAVFVVDTGAQVRALYNMNVPQIGALVRMRALCLDGRAHPTGAGSDAAAWLCQSAPLWAFVDVCEMLAR